MLKRANRTWELHASPDRDKPEDACDFGGLACRRASEVQPQRRNTLPHLIHHRLLHHQQPGPEEPVAVTRNHRYAHCQQVRGNLSTIGTNL